MAIKPYLTALQSPEIDTSDYILITTKLIQTLIQEDEAIEKFITVINNSYYKMDYKAALNNIDNLLKYYQQKRAENVDDAVIEIIQRSKLRIIDNPLKNQSRRYFETKLSKTIWDSLTGNEFASLSKLSALYEERLPGMNKKIPMEPKNLHEAAIVIGEMRDFGDSDKELFEEQRKLRKPADSIYQKKDRGGSRIDSKQDPPIYSVNPGIVRASSPMPFDERADKPAINRIPDLYNMDAMKPGYSAASRAVPYVNSVSGTTYTLAAVLIYYIKKYKKDPDLQKDIDNIIKAFVGFTAKQGYHSMSEMMDVLKDPYVLEILQSNHLSLNQDFLPEKELAKVTNAATSYAQTVMLQGALGNELRSKVKPLLVAYPSRREERYPTLLEDYLKESKITGPEVYKALMKIKYDEGVEAALDTLEKFQDYSATKNIEFPEIVELRKDFKQDKAFQQSKPKM